MSQTVREYVFQYRHQLGLLFSAFLLGLLLGGSLYWHAKRQIVVNQEEIERVTEEKKKVLRKLAAAEVEARVLRSSQVDLKKTLEEREKTIVEHETSLEFYRQLMVIDDKKEGLDLNTYTVTRGDEAHVFHLRFTFVQYSKQHQVLDGKVNIRLEGRERGIVAVYYVRDLLIEAKPDFGQLTLKYFQVIAGDILLPAGFQPQHIVIDATVKSKKEPWQRKLAWQIEES